MKKVLIMLVTVILFAGCLKEESSSDANDSVGSTTYEISNIQQGYDNNDSITGVLTNTGTGPMREIILVAIVEDKALFGVTDKDTLLPGESTEFLITSTIGANDIRLAGEIEYRVMYD